MQKKDEQHNTPHDEVAPARQRQPDTQHIDELRKRLYARGGETTGVVRHDLPPREVPSSRPNPAPLSPRPAPVSPAQPVRESMSSDTIGDMTRVAKRKKMRIWGALVGGGFFLFAALVSLILMFWGGNTVSGQNISLTISGGLTVGGGAEYEFQVAVANQNPVPIQSATLFVEYPRGTQSASEAGKEISIETHRLDTVASGQLVNVPFEARIFGEEDEEKEIRVWIEYRVAGSNATFERRAEAHTIKVSTSPVLVSLVVPSDVSSGQEIVVEMVVQSNAPTELKDILIKATYPNGFDFTESDTDTLSGEDMWRIASLAPDEKKTITLRGIITGYEGDARVFGVAVGVAREGASNTLASTLATDEETVTLQASQLNVGVTVNGSSQSTIVIANTEPINITLEYKNDLNAAVYNSRVELKFGGSALDAYDVDRVAGASYDSRTQSIVWEPGLNSELREMLPGKTVRLTARLNPDGPLGRTPQIDIAVGVSAGRLPDQSGSQTLKGETLRTVRIEGAPVFTSQTNYTEGPFVNTGPLPPVVGKMTQYTYLFTAKAGANDLTGAEVTAVLPAGVSWLDLVTPGDEVTYTSSTRTLRWIIGDISANSEATAGVQVSFVPTAAHVGSMPTILESQRFRATDRFTGTTVRVDAPALTTNLGTGLSRVEED